MTPEQSNPSSKPLLGAIAALSVVFIWSTWLVISRAGALSPLTPYDMAAMRYGISALITLPIVIFFKPWKTMPLRRIITVTVLLGPIYVLAVFGGYKLAPAAHGGIFMNGALPLITLIITWKWLSKRPSKQEIFAALVILLGVILTVGDTTFAFLDTWPGDLMFIVAALFFSLFLIVSRLWKVTPLQVLMCSLSLIHI